MAHALIINNQWFGKKCEITENQYRGVKLLCHQVLDNQQACCIWISYLSKITEPFNNRE